jgi:hypothetical protein
MECSRVKNIEVPKSRINPDCSLQGTRVGKLACSGIWHSGEIEGAKEKIPEVLKFGVHPDHSLKEVHVRRS